MYGEPDLWARADGDADRGRRSATCASRSRPAPTRCSSSIPGWACSIRSPTNASVLPYTRRIFAALRGLAPTIHFSTGTVQLLDQIAAAGSDLVSVDWRLPLDVAWERIGSDRGIQGNLDPTLLSRRSTRSRPARATCCAAPAGGRGTSSISATASCRRPRSNTSHGWSNSSTPNRTGQPARLTCLRARASRDR